MTKTNFVSNIVLFNSNLLSDSQILLINESLNKELNWNWSGNRLIVPQCEDMEDKFENATALSHW